MTKDSILKDPQYREQIVNRIRKLLAMSKGTQYEEEAGTALRMAQEHMSKYGLSMTDIEISQELEEDIVEEILQGHTKRASPERWESYLAQAVAIVFDCRVIRSIYFTDSFLKFVGYKKDAEMAKLVFNILFIAARSAACKRYPQGLGSTRLDQLSFMLGVAYRLIERAEKEKSKAQEESTGRYALVVLGKTQHIDNWMEKHLNLEPSSKRRGMSINTEAFNQGKKHGDSMDMLNREKIKEHA